MSATGDLPPCPEFVAACERGDVFQRDPRPIGPDGFTPLAPEGVENSRRVEQARRHPEPRGRAMTATIRRVARPRGELSPATLRRLEKSKDRAQDAEILYRRDVLAALDEGSFSAVSEATGLSTNTLQRWKREAGK